MDQTELIARMRGRIDMCRRLAKTTTDQRIADILMHMADDSEQDIDRLEGEKTVITITPDKSLG